MNRFTTQGLVLAALLLAWGSAMGQLQSEGRQFWQPGSAGVGIQPEQAAEFGFALSVGDYNCDGLDDAAFGIPGGEVSDETSAGRVLVLYSENFETGLDAANSQVWSQAGPVVPGDASSDARFGYTLASGDFDADGCDDLAIGAPGDVVDDTFMAGSVTIIYGSGEVGLNADEVDYWHQGPASVGATVGAFDQFGTALAVGDFNDNGFDDLAVGVPGEDIGAVPSAGAVHILFGSLTGINPTGTIILQRGINLSDSPQANEQLGLVLAAGEIDIMAGDELVIGSPLYDAPGDLFNSGAILVVSDIDDTIVHLTFTQDSPGIPDEAEVDDHLGSSLAIGDFDGNGFDDIAAGVRSEDIEQLTGSRTMAGAVNIFDLTEQAHQFWTQNDLPQEQAEQSDQFGSSLAAADFDGDGTDDLAIGVAGEDLEQVIDSGIVHVLYGDQNDGLTANNAQLWQQTIEPPSEGDGFGSSMAVGTINGGPTADLVIGSPFNSISELLTGSATVLYSLSIDDVFIDGFEED